MNAPADAGVDATHADSGDATIDRTISEASADVNVADTTIDVAADVAIDAGTDAPADVEVLDGSFTMGDGAGIDVYVPPSLTLGQFETDVVQAYCQRIAQCCSTVDAGGGFNTSKCLSLVSTGWEQSLAGTQTPGVLDGGNIAFNSDAGAKCIADLETFACGAITAAAYSQITADCFAPLRGTIAIGNTGCRNTVECNGGYCDSTVDGGLCTALHDSGAPCSDQNYNDGCSYRSSDVPPLFCDDLTGTGSNDCTPLRPLDAGCITNVECASGVCGDNGNCATERSVISFGTCHAFALPDGG